MNQRTLWNNIHAGGEHAVYSQVPSEFAEEAVSFFPERAAIIELGCGFGADAAFFAQQNRLVTATDLSDVAIERDEREYSHVSGLTFQVLDMGDGTLPFQSSEFDGVYARLSLHYYPDKITKQLFQDIRRILKLGGHLAFMCKSIDDPLFGKGQQLEENMFDNGGHIRHFFDENYVKTLLGGYRIIKLENKRDALYGRPSAYIEVVAQKI
jgi:SAM-dependent methyltransferase